MDVGVAWEKGGVVVDVGVVVLSRMGVEGPGWGFVRND